MKWPLYLPCLLPPASCSWGWHLPVYVLPSYLPTSQTCSFASTWFLQPEYHGVLCFSNTSTGPIRFLWWLADENLSRGQLMFGLAKTVKDRTEYSSSYIHPPQVQHFSLSELKGSHPFFFHKDNTLSKPGLRSPQPNTSDKCLKQPPNRKSCVI